ncbi:MAG: amino acid adenylation domain-containing protein [Pseudomonadota bacterium]
MAALLDHALAHWATATPEAEAVRSAGRSFTYGELNAGAEAIAARLIRSGVRPGDRIAIHAPKSFEAIASVFGVLRAGGVYVPIDPAAPKARIKTILRDCGVRLVLADARRVGALSGVTFVPVWEMAATLSERLEADPVPRTAADLGYILYTSGSTGAPKGICHTHRSGLAYARMSAKLCGLRRSDRVSHHTPLHFDMSIFDIFATVEAGATIVVISEMHAKMPASLAQLVEAEKISVWYSVPFAMAQLVSHGALDKRDLSSLRVVMFAGEVMQPRVLRDFAAHVPEAELLNAYGPTETNHCLTARIDHATLDGLTALPIGLPDEGIEMRVAHDGELLIKGDQVMAGYWNDLSRSKAAFDGRYYKTGDIVSRRVDGQVMLVGRDDRQVKLRGFRVELDEVERVLSSLPGIEEVAVVTDKSGEVLNAYYAGDPSPSEVQGHAAAHLPAYMVPAEFVQRDALNRTSTGKLDRRSIVEFGNDRSAA